MQDTGYPDHHQSQALNNWKLALKQVWLWGLAFKTLDSINAVVKPPRKVIPITTKAKYLKAGSWTLAIKQVWLRGLAFKTLDSMDAVVEPPWTG
ncbi:MAG: hypothetical protein GYB33_16060, partial [Gammaproteobacteria bacterium]|nr:hypothetical protein [Gammaproteobacteria bacterium]